MQQRSTAVVRVIVEQANKHRPVFTVDTYTVNVTESAHNNKEMTTRLRLLTVTAVDIDAGEYGRVHYAFDTTLNEHETNKIFEINSTTGDIMLVSPLDYETRRQYRLTIIAADSGRPVKTGRCTVEVRVLDANDHPPTFAPNTSYFINVHRQSPIGTHLIQVHAVDRDTLLNRVTYTLLNTSDTLSVLELDVHTGRLSVRRPLSSLGTLSRLQVVVGAVDEAQLVSTDNATVNIVVVDNVNQIPTFEHDVYEFDIEETFAVGQVIGIVNGSDYDTNPVSLHSDLYFSSFNYR
jgi:hypothetical protein